MVTTSKVDPNLLQGMDEAATDAENDLINVDEGAIKAIAEWWSKWYKGAGHKRLGRVLLSQLKE